MDARETQELLVVVEKAAMEGTASGFFERTGLDRGGFYPYMEERLKLGEELEGGGGVLAAMNSAVSLGYHLALQTVLKDIAALVPTEEDRDGAPGRLEDLADILDSYGVPRPATSDYEAH